LRRSCASRSKSAPPITSHTRARRSSGSAAGACVGRPRHQVRACVVGIMVLASR
jgi:hypothetical protein